MRKIGLIGAVNWYAMSLYFHRINTQIHKRIGGTCSPPIILESLNCGDISSDLSDADWDSIAKALVASARRMEDAGASALLICANSMHAFMIRWWTRSIFPSCISSMQSERRSRPMG